MQGALVAQRGPDFPPSTSGSARGAAVPVTPLSQGHGESRVGGSLNSCLPRGRCSHSGSFALPALSPCHLENCARFLPGEAAGWTLRSFPTFGRGKDGMNWSHYITELSRFLTVCSLTGTSPDVRWDAVSSRILNTSASCLPVGLTLWRVVFRGARCWVGCLV